MCYFNEFSLFTRLFANMATASIVCEKIEFFIIIREYFPFYSELIQWTILSHLFTRSICPEFRHRRSLRSYIVDAPSCLATPRSRLSFQPEPELIDGILLAVSPAKLNVRNKSILNESKCVTSQRSRGRKASAR